MVDLKSLPFKLKRTPLESEGLRLVGLKPNILRIILERGKTNE